jgi:hypothetical protein
MRRPLLSLAAAVTLVAATASPALAGPPWLSIESPANPMNKSAQGAYLLADTFHHEQAVSFVVEARAEGLVNGQRKTLPLTLERTDRDGVYALQAAFGRRPATGSSSSPARRARAPSPHSSASPMAPFGASACRRRRSRTGAGLCRCR